MMGWLNRIGSFFIRLWVKSRRVGSRRVGSRRSPRLNSPSEFNWAGRSDIGINVMDDYLREWMDNE